MHVHSGSKVTWNPEIVEWGEAELESIIQRLGVRCSAEEACIRGVDAAGRAGLSPQHRRTRQERSGFCRPVSVRPL